MLGAVSARDIPVLITNSAGAYVCNHVFYTTRHAIERLGLGIPSFSLLAQMSDTEIAAHHARHQAEYLAQNMSAAKLHRWIRQTRELGHAQIMGKGIAGVGMRFAVGSCGAVRS